MAMLANFIYSMEPARGLNLSLIRDPDEDKRITLLVENGLMVLKSMGLVIHTDSVSIQENQAQTLDTNTQRLSTPATLPYMVSSSDSHQIRFEEFRQSLQRSITSKMSRKTLITR